MFMNLKKTLIYRFAMTASGKKTVMKLCSMRRDEGIPPLKVMASLLGLQWRACITCDPSNHICLFWDQKKSHPKAGETFFFLSQIRDRHWPVTVVQGGNTDLDYLLRDGCHVSRHLQCMLKRKKMGFDVGNNSPEMWISTGNNATAMTNK